MSSRCHSAARTIKTCTDLILQLGGLISVKYRKTFQSTPVLLALRAVATTGFSWPRTRKGIRCIEVVLTRWALLRLRTGSLGKQDEPPSLPGHLGWIIHVVSCRPLNAREGSLLRASVGRLSRSSGHLLSLDHFCGISPFAPKRGSRSPWLSRQSQPSTLVCAGSTMSNLQAGAFGPPPLEIRPSESLGP
jgi:hypothetical protein